MRLFLHLISSSLRGILRARPVKKIRMLRISANNAKMDEKLAVAGVVIRSIGDPLIMSDLQGKNTFMCLFCNQHISRQQPFKFKKLNNYHLL